MSYEVGQPIIQPLGFQGEEFLLKIIFPIRKAVQQTERTNDFDPPTYVGPAGKRGIILKFRAEDFPLHRYDDSLVHFDLGQAIRERLEASC